MGKQICFFNTPKEYMNLVEIIKANDGILVDYENKEINSVCNNYYVIKLKNSDLFYWDTKYFMPYKSGHYIDRTASDILVLNCCNASPTNDDPIGYEHGRLWYEPSFFDNEGKLVKKSKDLNSFYNLLKKHITNNYIISKNKHWYIGTEAYDLYLQGKFTPYSGITKIEF